jgi:hypothetical protein
MFSTLEKQHLAAEIEQMLLELGHPEMPTEKPEFRLHVDGKESWSWADIEPNWKFSEASPAQTSPWNEVAREALQIMTDEVVQVRATTIVVADKPGDQRSVSVGLVPGHGVWIGLEKNEETREVCLTMEAAKALQGLLAEAVGKTETALERALRRIAKWHGEFPGTGKFYDAEKTQPMSYAGAFGSDGERDYMRKIAQEALDRTNEASGGVDLGALVKAAARALGSLSATCPHRSDTDCAEPSMEFSHMLCSASNCPLLLKY